MFNLAIVTMVTIVLWLFIFVKGQYIAILSKVLT